MPGSSSNNSGETDFEKGISDASSRVKKVTSDDFKKTTQAFIGQLYGKSDQPGDAQDTQDPNLVKSPELLNQKSSSQHQVQHTQGQMPKMQNSNPVKRTHTQNYYDPTIGDLEMQIKRERDKREKEQQQRKQQFEEEEQQKKQEVEAANRAAPPVARGRNRMGKKADMGLKMSQQKTETFRGASG